MRGWSRLTRITGSLYCQNRQNFHISVSLFKDMFEYMNLDSAPSFALTFHASNVVCRRDLFSAIYYGCLLYESIQRSCIRRPWWSRHATRLLLIVQVSFRPQSATSRKIKLSKNETVKVDLCFLSWPATVISGNFFNVLIVRLKNADNCSAIRKPSLDPPDLNSTFLLSVHGAKKKKSR